MVFFDIDGTLFDHKLAEKAGALVFFQKRRELFQLPVEHYLHLWTDLTEKYYQLYLKGMFSFSEQRRARIRELYSIAGSELTDEEADMAFADYLENYQQAWTTFSDVIPCLRELQNMGLGIITNGDHKQQTAKLNQVGIRHYFSVIVSSGDVGFAKPDRRIFLEACARADREPVRCYYIGDLFEADYIGSTSAGLRGIWLNRTGQELSPDYPIHAVNSLEQLPSLIKGNLRL